jgi:hypothetical protein
LARNDEASSGVMLNTSTSARSGSPRADCTTERPKLKAQADEAPNAATAVATAVMVLRPNDEQMVFFKTAPAAWPWHFFGDTLHPAGCAAAGSKSVEPAAGNRKSQQYQAYSVASSCDASACTLSHPDKPKV